MQNLDCKSVLHMYMQLGMQTALPSDSKTKNAGEFRKFQNLSKTVSLLEVSKNNHEQHSLSVSCHLETGTSILKKYQKHTSVMMAKQDCLNVGKHFLRKCYGSDTVEQG